MADGTTSDIRSNEKDEVCEVKIQKLKEKYSREMRDDKQNPIKVCMSLVFQAATVKDKAARLRISQQLSTYLTQPNGMINLFLSLIDFDPSSQNKTTHQQRFQAVANIVACMPKLCMNYTDYCANITKQLKPLLLDDNPKYSSLASVLIRNLLESPHNRDGPANDVILGPILSAIKSEDRDDSNKHLTYSLSESIIAISNLCRNLFPTSEFVQIFPELFYCYYTILDTPSRLKALMKTSLAIVLNDLNHGPAICLLEETLFYKTDLSKVFEISTEHEGEISIRHVKSDEAKFCSDILDTAQKFDTTRRAVFSLLEESNDNTLLLEYFFQIQSRIWSSQCDDQRLQCVFMIEPLLEDAASDNTSAKTSTKLDLFEAILSNSQQALNLIGRTFLNYIEYLRNVDSSNEQKSAAKKLIDPSTRSCLSIMEILIVSEGNKSSIRAELVEKMLPILLEIRGLLTGFEGDSSIKSLDSTIVRLSELAKNDDFNASKSSHVKSSDRELASIIKDLNDDLVPVRVHALVRLKQLIMLNDKNAIESLGKMFNLLESCLDDQESYVFLACINLMAEISLRNTDEMLVKLMSLYNNQDLSIQHRLNVGEVLVRLTKQLNKTTPHYASKIIATMLHSARNDPNELCQMSSLTNLGELCRYLGDSLGKYMLDILACLEFILHSNQSIQVKCACVELLRTALMGVDKFTCESIQQEVKSIYSMLKHQRYRTLDERFCFLIDLALDEIGRLAKELLGLEASSDEEHSRGLVKKIDMLRLLN